MISRRRFFPLESAFESEGTLDADWSQVGNFETRYADWFARAVLRSRALVYVSFHGEPLALIRLAQRRTRFEYL